MTVGANGEVTGSGFERVSDAAPVRVKLGREVRIGVVEAPSGRAGVSVREWITPDGYPTDTPMPKRAGAKRRMNRTAFIARHGSDGCADKFRGLSMLTADQAFALAESLVAAAIALESAETDDDGEMSA